MTEKSYAEYQEGYDKANEEWKARVQILWQIADALEDFKLKCYARMKEGSKEYKDFIMKNAPCSYDLQALKKELLSCKEEGQ